MRILALFIPVALLAQSPAANPAKPATAKPATSTQPAATKPALAAPAPAKPATAKPKPAPFVLATEDDKTIYALGLSMYRSLSQFDLSPAELEIVKRAIADAAAGRPALDASTRATQMDALARARAARAAERERVLAAAYFNKAAAAPGAVTVQPGLVYQELAGGSGASPKATDTVKVHYRGTLIDGTEFDSSYKRNEPAQFPLNRVIKCWTEGVQKMKVGGKARLVCPSDVAYGDRGHPPVIPGGATLIFEIELLDIAAASAQ